MDSISMDTGQTGALQETEAQPQVEIPPAKFSGHKITEKKAGGGKWKERRPHHSQEPYSIERRSSHKSSEKVLVLEPTATSSYQKTSAEYYKEFKAEYKVGGIPYIDEYLRSPSENVRITIMAERIAQELSDAQKEEHFRQAIDPKVVVRGKEGTSLITYNHLAFSSWGEGKAALEKYFKIDDSDPEKQRLERQLGIKCLEQQITEQRAVELIIDFIDRTVVKDILEGKGKELLEKGHVNLAITVIVISRCMTLIGNKAILWPGFEIHLSDNFAEAHAMFMAFARYLDALKNRSLDEFEAARKELDQ